MHEKSQTGVFKYPSLGSNILLCLGGRVRLVWDISDSDVAKWRNFVDANINNEFVRERQKRNIDRATVDLSKGYLWHVHVGCQVTSVQRSGPNSPVFKFLNSNSPALDYQECLESPDVKSMLISELSKSGLRRNKIIAENLTSTLKVLESGLWEGFVEVLQSAFENGTQELERNAANFLSENFRGIGLKQSRNYIQWIGISQYEIPLDSRVTKVMKRLGASFVPNAAAMSDAEVYYMVQGGLQLLADKLGIKPCILDACIFSSFDE